jgi:hypothetical protein
MLEDHLPPLCNESIRRHILVETNAPRERAGVRERRATSAVAGMPSVDGGAATLIRPSATFSRRRLLKKSLLTGSGGQGAWLLIFIIP